MPKVILNKTVKIEGKGLVFAGTSVDVTPKEKKDLEANGLIGPSAKDTMPTNEKEVRELQAKVAELQAKVDEDSTAKIAELEGQVTTLTEELTTLKQGN